MNHSLNSIDCTDWICTYYKWSLNKQFTCSRCFPIPLLPPPCVLSLQGGKITYSQVALGWKGPSKVILPNTPAESEETSNQIKLPRATLDLILNFSRVPGMLPQPHQVVKATVSLAIHLQILKKTHRVSILNQTKAPPSPELFSLVVRLGTWEEM